MTNYTITPHKLMTLVGVKSRQRLQQIRLQHLKENEHFIRLANNYFLYNELAVNKLKEIRK